MSAQVAAVKVPCGKESPRDLGIEMVAIPAGPFLMGEEARDGAGRIRLRATPQRQVTLDAFFISRHPITVGQYRVFADATGHPPPPVADDDGLPVARVSWHEAEGFCRWLSLRTGCEARLPTEAEWEKAARGTDGRTYPWGEAPPMSPSAKAAVRRRSFVPAYPWGEERVGLTWRCNCANAVGGRSRVGSYPAGASPYGCLDMAGNVWEWCADWFDPEYYRCGPCENPTGPSAGRNRVIRGGAYDSAPDVVRCAARFYDRPGDEPFFAVGFRVVIEDRSGKAETAGLGIRD